MLGNLFFLFFFFAQGAKTFAQNRMCTRIPHLLHCIPQLHNLGWLAAGLRFGRVQQDLQIGNAAEFGMHLLIRVDEVLNLGHGELSEEVETHSSESYTREMRS